MAQYWETAAPRNAYLAVAVTVVVSQFFFVRSAMSHWGDPVRQNLRARAAAYRKIAHIARREGIRPVVRIVSGDIRPFAAAFRPDVDDREQSESEGADVAGHP